jgi:hypothetical protein
MKMTKCYLKQFQNFLRRRNDSAISAEERATRKKGMWRETRSSDKEGGGREARHKDGLVTGLNDDHHARVMSMFIAKWK